MRDFPVFDTQWGIGSITLSQIPYTGCAYVRVRSASDAKAFLRECVDFCVACGAETVLATGHDLCHEYPLHTKILKMQAIKSAIGATDACLFPVTEETANQWRQIYLEKIRDIPNAAYMTTTDLRMMLQKGDGYFIHRSGELLGIGRCSDGILHWVASVRKNAGEDVVKALCSVMSEETVSLEVASTNAKAMALYEKMGFIPVVSLEEWNILHKKV